MKVLVAGLYAIGTACTLFAYSTMEEARRLFPLNPSREVRANIVAALGAFSAVASSVVPAAKFPMEIKGDGRRHCDHRAVRGAMRNG